MQNIEHKAVQNILHVAVVAILKADRVLISKRAKEAHQGGLWEFPGGKLETGEDIEAACVREIQEELGIRLVETRPLIKILHHYADKSVLLEIRLCAVFDGREYPLADMHTIGEQYGLEGQQVKWVQLKKLNNYQFPEANQSIIDALTLADKYVISPDCQSSVIEQFIEQFRENCSYYSLIQLRVKSLKGEQLQLLIKSCAAIAKKLGVRLLLNSDCINMADDNINGDGIHLTSTHLFDNDFIDSIRQRFPEKIISASCHQNKDIEQANHCELNFIVISPVQKTTSHIQQVPIGWKSFESLTNRANMPCFALGGMKKNDVYLAQEHGGQGVAGISALWKLTSKSEDES